MKLNEPRRQTFRRNSSCQQATHAQPYNPDLLWASKAVFLPVLTEGTSISASAIPHSWVHNRDHLESRKKKKINKYSNDFATGGLPLLSEQCQFILGKTQHFVQYNYSKLSLLLLLLLLLHTLNASQYRPAEKVEMKKTTTPQWKQMHAIALPRTTTHPSR